MGRKRRNTIKVDKPKRPKCKEVTVRTVADMLDALRTAPPTAKVWPLEEGIVEAFEHTCLSPCLRINFDPFV